MKTKKLVIEICPHWDGTARVCDLKRCRRWVTKECYHQPYLVNGVRKTVKQMLLIILRAGIYSGR